eukprot:NODE_2_length_91304_cov_0.692462.p83 type:complete len:101 gc:universal NODE_2_length_91304_cov_0.692462:14401-14703(+)
MPFTLLIGMSLATRKFKSTNCPKIGASSISINFVIKLSHVTLTLILYLKSIAFNLRTNFLSLLIDCSSSPRSFLPYSSNPKMNGIRGFLTALKKYFASNS